MGVLGTVVQVASTLALLSPVFLLGATAAALAPDVLPPKNGKPHFVPAGLKGCAPVLEKLYQPALDFEGNSCYNTAVVDKGGMFVESLPEDFVRKETSVCRNMEYLRNSNVYSRGACDHHWCVILYGYYFEQDPKPILWSKQTQEVEWHYAAVWIYDDVAQWVTISAETGFEHFITRKAKYVKWDGTHPKLISNHTDAGTHPFRFAGMKDSVVQNESGEWYQSSLVSHYGGFYSPEFREKFYEHLYGRFTGLPRRVSLGDKYFFKLLQGAARPNWYTEGCPLEDPDFETCDQMEKDWINFDVTRGEIYH